MKYTFLLITGLLVFTNCGTQKKVMDTGASKEMVKF